MFVVAADAISLPRHEITKTYDDKYDPPSYLQRRIAYFSIRIYRQQDKVSRERKIVVEKLTRLKNLFVKFSEQHCRVRISEIQR